MIKKFVTKNCFQHYKRNFYHGGDRQVLKKSETQLEAINRYLV